MRANCHVLIAAKSLIGLVKIGLAACAIVASLKVFKCPPVCLDDWRLFERCSRVICATTSPDFRWGDNDGTLLNHNLLGDKK